MELLDFIFHIDQYLHTLIANYGSWIYVILFLIIFVETGLVIMPFLPGDSLLFATGMLIAQTTELDITLAIVLLLIAAISGDSLNYFIGMKAGMKMTKIRLFGKQVIKEEHLDKTHAFYEKYGERTIVIARFIPIVRTLAPFVAGVGSMRYRTFMLYNVIGGIIWVVGLTLAGYFLGNLPIVKDNFSKIALLIIFVSILPIIFEFIKAKMKKNK
ncbi:MULTISPECIES: DedA family protein [unclassified Myroides]|uniref:DedA family protein n=1 Tax=unclassified Myroides TaxID=2642485 RepID=UPI0015FB5AC2|nr:MULTISPECIES: DedA family protein [unclassified Myroides]MBB1150162.1 DedA family protein [Myroides sp. NP-2]MDM1408395.1 DedA family protein [Myroides sp. DF42-4-2]